MNRVHKQWVIPAMCLFICVFSPLAQAEMREASEYEVKSAFIYNFAKFAEWPQEVLDGTLNICSLGEDPFGNALISLSGKTVGKRGVVIKRISMLNDAGDCNLLFISSSEKWRIKEITKSVEGSNILTVGDTDGYANSGVMINLFMEKNKVRFEINLDAVMRSGLRISPRLLKLARIVREDS